MVFLPDPYGIRMGRTVISMLPRQLMAHDRVGQPLGTTKHRVTRTRGLTLPEDTPLSGQRERSMVGPGGPAVYHYYYYYYYD